MSEITAEQALQRLTAACARAEHCSGEMREKMYHWGLDESTQDQVIDYLTTHRYIDDERFTRLFVRDKMQFNKWGRKKIEQALWGKHVKESVYLPILDEIDKNEWKTILLPLLETKRKSLHAASDYERKVKLIRFAMSRGFTMDIIEDCLSTNCKS